MKHSTENWIWKQAGNQGQLLITAIISLFLMTHVHFQPSCFFWSYSEVVVVVCFLVFGFFSLKLESEKSEGAGVRGTLPLCLVVVQLGDTLKSSDH